MAAAGPTRITGGTRRAFRTRRADGSSRNDRSATLCGHDDLLRHQPSFRSWLVESGAFEISDTLLKLADHLEEGIGCGKRTASSVDHIASACLIARSRGLVVDSINLSLDLADGLRDGVGPRDRSGSPLDVTGQDVVCLSDDNRVAVLAEEGDGLDVNRGVGGGLRDDLQLLRNVVLS